MNNPPTHPLPQTSVPDPSHAAPPTGKRRRLWELPTQAHELLLALSFKPELLRKQTARALGKVHKGIFKLQGGDADMLYSVVHDMGTRNPLSEAFHKLLLERHALATQRLASVRDVGQLQAAWALSLQGDDLPSTLWAVLTHNLGEALQVPVLYEARGWVFALARRGAEFVHAQLEEQVELLGLRQEADALRSRLLHQQQQAAEETTKASLEVARLRGDLWRCQAELEAMTSRAAPAAIHKSHRRDAPVSKPVAPTAMFKPKLGLTPAATPTAAALPKTSPDPVPDVRLTPITVQDRQVLCVGGIQHAVARYRARIERLGGHFEHHDGGLQDSFRALDGRLSRADVVICQTGCINHEAYQRVKRYCERTGTPCVYLERPSLSRLDRALFDMTINAEKELHHAA